MYFFFFFYFVFFLHIFKITILLIFRFSGKGAVLGNLTNSQSVSFRQGTNVEFGPTEFNNGPGGGVYLKKKVIKLLFNINACVDFYRNHWMWNII